MGHRKIQVDMLSFAWSTMKNEAETKALLFLWISFWPFRVLLLCFSFFSWITSTNRTKNHCQGGEICLMISVSSFQPATQLLVSLRAESMKSKSELSYRWREPSVTTLFLVFLHGFSFFESKTFWSLSGTTKMISVSINRVLVLHLKLCKLQQSPK